MKSDTFLDRIKKGQRLIADGATGTNLQKRGLPAGTSGEYWVLENPEAIMQLHRDFIAAGAQIILTSTFGASPAHLEGSQLAGQAIEINRRAVELARQAAKGKDVFVAGSIGPSGKLLQPFGPLPEAEATESFGEQARALTEAGADLLVIETQFDLKEATAAILGARSNSQLPIVCSFSFDRGTRTIMGVKPAQFANEMNKLGVDLIGINCGRSLDENLAVLKEVRQATPLPVWFKPNAGLPETDAEGNAFYRVTPEEMSRRVPEWIAAGAQVIGGCCGTSPDHLRQIAEAVRHAS